MINYSWPSLVDVELRWVLYMHVGVDGSVKGLMDATNTPLLRLCAGLLFIEVWGTHNLGLHV